MNCWRMYSALSKAAGDAADCANAGDDDARRAAIIRRWLAGQNAPMLPATRW